MDNELWGHSFGSSHQGLSNDRAAKDTSLTDRSPKLLGRPVEIDINLLNLKLSFKKRHVVKGLVVGGTYGERRGVGVVDLCNQSEAVTAGIDLI